MKSENPSGGLKGSSVEVLGIVAQGGKDKDYELVAARSTLAIIGVRDEDHDGKPEFCAKFSIPVFTVGACLEQFW